MALAGCLGRVVLGVLCGCSSSNSTMTGLTPDFSLYVSTQSVFVPIGVGSGNMQLSVVASNGSSEAVSVSVNGLPTGVTSTPSSPFTMNAGTSQTVSFRAQSGTKPALQQISFQATSGTVSHSSAISLSVANPVYAYVASLNPPPNNILDEYSVDANSGKVSELSASPASLPSFPEDIVVASETGGAFLFVLTSDATSQSSRTLSSFKVDAASGSLTLLQTINYQPGGNQEYLAVHPRGKFLYVTQSTCTLAYLIDPATGNLTESSCSADGMLPAFAPPGNFAFGPEPGHSGNLATYSVNQNDGSLTVLQTIPFYDLALAPVVFACDRLGHALYALQTGPGIAGCGAFFIWAIDPNTGSLTQIYSSYVNTSFGRPCLPKSISFTPTNSFAYVLDLGGNNITFPPGFYAGAVDPASGNLTNVPGSPFATEGFPVFAVVEPSQGLFMFYTVRQGSGPNTITSWAINPNTGALTQVAGVATPVVLAAPLKMVVVAP